MCVLECTRVSVAIEGAELVSDMCKPSRFEGRTLRKLIANPIVGSEGHEGEIRQQPREL